MACVHCNLGCASKNLACMNSFVCISLDYIGPSILLHNKCICQMHGNIFVAKAMVSILVGIRSSCAPSGPLVILGLFSTKSGVATLSFVLWKSQPEPNSSWICSHLMMDSFLWPRAWDVWSLCTYLESFGVHAGVLPRASTLRFHCSSARTVVIEGCMVGSCREHTLLHFQGLP